MSLDLQGIKGCRVQRLCGEEEYDRNDCDVHKV